MGVAFQDGEPADDPRACLDERHGHAHAGLRALGRRHHLRADREDDGLRVDQRGHPEELTEQRVPDTTHLRRQKLSDRKPARARVEGGGALQRPLDLLGGHPRHIGRAGSKSEEELGVEVAGNPEHLLDREHHHGAAPEVRRRAAGGAGLRRGSRAPPARRSGDGERERPTPSRGPPHVVFVHASLPPAPEPSGPRGRADSRIKVEPRRFALNLPRLAPIDIQVARLPIGRFSHRPPGRPSTRKPGARFA